MWCLLCLALLHLLSDTHGALPSEGDYHIMDSSTAPRELLSKEHVTRCR
jgi:hypothetical protein